MTPLTVKLHDATHGATCAERVVILSVRVSEALVWELRYRADKPVSLEQYETDLAQAPSRMNTPALHACAMMDPAGTPKDPPSGPAKKCASRRREDAAENELYNSSVDSEHFRDAVNAIDDLAVTRDDLEILRAKILALDGILSPAGEGDDRSVWDLAEELSCALSEPLETLRKTEDMFDKIGMLDPRNEHVEEDEQSR